MQARLFLFFFLLLASSLKAQNTVGLIDAVPQDVQDGYNLIFPHNQSNVFLIDNCGRRVNEWIGDPTYGPANGVYLSEEGLLYKCIGQGPQSNAFIHAGGGGEGIEIRDWDNTLVWQWFYNDSLVRLHHDIAIMPNGNILAIAWERFTAQEAIDQGRDPDFLSEGELWPDHIIEIQPEGSNEANIVWEWHAWDHLIQDFDDTKPNFGVVEDHPEKIDINYGMDADADWHHMNSIDYNPSLDQILLSVPHFDEVWIIDHSTTTAQAATSSGGLTGKGGDLLYRWGNPQTYDRGTDEDQQLFFNHDAHWIAGENLIGQNDYGKIMIFNNQVGADFSSVEIITPIFDSYYWEYTLNGATYDPIAPFWTYTRDTPQDLYSTGLSSAQRLPNGNTLVLAGRTGYAFEINNAEEVVWEYKVPLLQGQPVSQGTVIPANGNLTFRMRRYTPSYAGFDGQVLVAGDYIEIDPSLDCPFDISVSELLAQKEITAYPNPTNAQLSLDGDFNLSGLGFEVCNMMGQTLMAGRWAGNLNVEELPAGYYSLKFDSFELPTIRFSKL